MIKATFAADFTSFTSAVEKAEVTLTNFNDSAGNVQKRLDKISDGFSGRKLIQDAQLMATAVGDIGGTASLTSKELEKVGNQARNAIDKMRALGIEPPANLRRIADEAKGATGNLTSMLGTAGKLGAAFGIGFGVSEAISFGKVILDNADALTRMSDVTGISLQGLQKLQAAGDDSGNSIDQITGAVTKLQDKLANGDASAVGALTKLGISFEDIRGLSPDRQFMAIGDAVAGIKDPAEQVSVAIDLFGRAGADVLPTLKRGFQDLRDATVGASDESIKALDVFGDALQSAARKAKAAATEIAGSFIQQIWISGGVVSEATLQFQKLQESIKTPNLAGKPFNIGIPTEKELEASFMGLDQIKNRFAGLRDEQEANAKAAEKLRIEHEKLLAAFVREVEGVDDLKFKTLALSDALAGVGGTKFKPTIKDIGDTSLRSATDVDGLSGSVEDLERQGRFAEATLKKMGITIGVLPKVTGQTEESIGEAKTATQGWRTDLDHLAVSMTQFATISGDSFGGVSKDIANVTASLSLAIKAYDAFKAKNATTADKISAAIGGAAAVQQATSGGSKTARVVGGAASGAVTGAAIASNPALSGSTLGLSIAVGAGVGALVGWIRSGKADKDMNKARQSFVDAAGGLGMLDKKAFDAGTTLDAFLDAKHPEAYNAALTDLNAALEKHDQDVQRVSDGVNGLTDAWQAGGQYIPASVRHVIDEMLTLDKLTEDQRKSLSAMSSAAEPDFAKLTKLAEGYGISLDALGPSFQQANISSQAQQILKDFDQLKEAGGDVGGVLLGMSDEVATLVTNALRFGAAIPESMRPIVQNLLEAGKLTDENGDKLEDLSKLSFGGSGLDKSTIAIVDAIEGLKDSLSDLPSKAEMAARRMAEEFKRNPIPLNFVASGGNPAGANPWDASADVPGFAGGTRGKLLNFGTGTLAMLHGRERVQTAGEVVGGDAHAEQLGVLNDRMDGLNRYLTQDFKWDVARLMRQMVAS